LSLHHERALDRDHGIGGASKHAVSGLTGPPSSRNIAQPLGLGGSGTIPPRAALLIDAERPKASSHRGSHDPLRSISPL
jgi:hypothetical protein